MTGVAFVLYTNYMVTDPGTTPSKPGSQFAFGAGVAITYGALTAAHVAYGLFFATALVCLIRGAFLWALHIVENQRAAALADQHAPVEAVQDHKPAAEPAAVTGIGTDDNPRVGSGVAA
jgi:hypothetical protein